MINNEKNANRSLLQESHYDKITKDYDAHYFDDTSIDFRKEFFYEYMFQGLDLNEKLVADLACSSGYNSNFVLSRYPKTKVFGFDISAIACEFYKTNTNCDAYKVDLTLGHNPCNLEFDVVMIIGGLHHCVSNLEGTFNTIKKMIKPGGILLMVEPNKESIFEWVRKIWYKCDKYFEANSEHALSHKELFSTYGQGFSILDCEYMGGPAYFLVYNSLIFRIPVRWKKIIAPPLMYVERLYNHLPGKFFFPYFVARWKRD